MKIAHLIKSLGRGGAESLLPLTIRHRGDGFDYAVGYFLPWKDALVAEVEAAGAPTHCFRAGSALAMLARVPATARWLRREGVDLVHCHLPLAGLVGRLAGRLAGIPVVYTEHNLQERYHRATALANRLSWRLQDLAVAVSGDVAASIGRRLDPRVPVEVVLNGIDVDHLPASADAAAAVRRRFGIAADAPLVGTVAVFRSQKRLDIWLDAARLLADARPDARFLLVGDGPLRSELEERARRLGLEERVVFTGLQDDSKPFFAALDVYMMSSEFEGLPLALLEAMASRRAVVTTPAGGIPEVIEDGKNGMLVPFGDAAALAAAAVALLADGEARRGLGAAARRRVEEDFSVARMAAQLEGFYREVVARRAA